MESRLFCCTFITKFKIILSSHAGKHISDKLFYYLLPLSAMGVPGLTTYINENADLFLREHHLQNCLVVIDGYALAAVLYYNYTVRFNSAFGGDYDKYAVVVSGFFERLEKCGVTPIVVCDGGYEARKINTIKKRTLQKIFPLGRAYSPFSRNLQSFPLMKRHVFREVLLKNKVPILQSDFEADSEIAALARKLGVPVLSNDSDFFIYDVQYIPLSSIELMMYETDEKGQHFIPCRIYSFDDLLKGFGGLPKNMVPLLATMLGNDYIKASQFKNFYSHLKTDISKKTSPRQRRVKGVVSWLRGESFESALDKILGSFKKEVRRRVRKSIQKIIKDYTNLYTPLEKYLPPEVKSKMKCNEIESDDLLADSLKRLVSINENDSENSSEEDETVLHGNLCPRDNVARKNVQEADNSAINNSTDKEDSDFSVSDEIPQWMLEESRRVNLCSTIFDIISLRIYLFDVQVEDHSLPHAGSIAVPILQTIMHCIGVDSITCWARDKNSYVGTQLNSLSPGIIVPELKELNQLSQSDKKEIIFKALKIDNAEILNLFPDEWHLYVMAIIYWIKSEKEVCVKPCHIYALIVTLVSVGVIGAKIGTFWKKKKYMIRYGTNLNKLRNRTPLKPKISSDSIVHITSTVTTDDCILAMDTLIPFFQTDENLKRRPVNFSRETLHLFAQLQYSFLLSNTLNSLLLMPFKRCDLSMFYNGTLLYNLTSNFKSRTNIMAYIEHLFKREPTLLLLCKTIYDKLSLFTADIPKQKQKLKKKSKCHKKTNQNKENNNMSDNNDESNEDEFNMALHPEDINNKFSILRRLIQ